VSPTSRKCSRWRKRTGEERETAASQTIRLFGTADPTIARTNIAVHQDAWLIDTKEQLTSRLFEVEDPEAQQCLITYRARIKSDGLAARAFLEMWCRFPGQGEFFSKGLHQTVSGTTEWASYEIPFYLKKKQKPDLIKLNLVVEGIGKVWIKDVELLRTPLST
jgi:hypothetical protein